MKKADRQTSIVELLRQHRTMRIPELAEVLGVSVITLRRDLTELESRSLIRKIYGGASYIDIPQSARTHPPFASRIARNHALKERIGMTAASLIHPGDSVILDIGTTCLEVARFLKRSRNITVLTNNVAILNELVDADLEVYSLGGRLRGSELSLTGLQAFSALRDFHTTRAFIGVGGISLDGGLTSYNRDSADLTSAIISRADHVCLVADSSKCGKTALCAVGSLDRVDTVITDSGMPEEYAAAFAEHGVQVILC